MKKHLVFLSSVLLIQTVAVSVFAQQKPKAGDIISGIVTDSVSPLMAVYITELDSREEPKIQHEYVDLGLSVKWATCNVGADKPEDYGDFFAWGELAPKESYTWENYRFRAGGNDYSDIRFSKYTSTNNEGKSLNVDDKTVLAPEDDAAHVYWGGEWRMPTYDEWNELHDSCTWTWTTVNSGPGLQFVNGYRIRSNVQGYTDSTIFLPAAGYYTSGNHIESSFNHYWSSSPPSKDSRYVRCLSFTPKDIYNETVRRSNGMPIRPVCP